MIAPIQLTPGMNQPTQNTIINNNFEKVKQDSITRIITDEDGNERILIGRRPDGTYGIDYALPGNSVKDASPDELGMSSRFNMYKIIANGKIVPQARTGNITLNSTDIAYENTSIIKLDDLIGALEYNLSGGLLVNITHGFRYDTEVVYALRNPFVESGLYYADGTNTIHYKNSWGLRNNELTITQRLMRTSGSLSITPAIVKKDVIFWELCNTTAGAKPPGGLGGGADAKYMFKDVTVFNLDGSVHTALASTRDELGPNWPYLLSLPAAY